MQLKTQLVQDLHLDPICGQPQMAFTHKNLLFGSTFLSEAQKPIRHFAIHIMAFSIWLVSLDRIFPENGFAVDGSEVESVGQPCVCVGVDSLMLGSYVG